MARRENLLKDRQRKVNRVLSLFRAAIPADEFDENDWDSLRVAVRVVYETEELGVVLRRKAIGERIDDVENWSESMEGAITFMSWIREIRQICTGRTYSTTTPVSVGALWKRHKALAARLITPKLSPGKRMSILVELGGIEVSLWGQVWALEPTYLRREASQTKRSRSKAPKRRRA